LKKSKVELYYNESVHAKMFILDDQVLSSSSMNLYTESTAGKSWESGIVSIDPYNVSLARESFDNILNAQGTKPQ
jgi:phosphatidylserine/phosphatidylglycerophosphate/cardiolipin synthase-like enzyme